MTQAAWTDVGLCVRKAKALHGAIPGRDRDVSSRVFLRLCGKPFDRLQLLRSCSSKTPYAELMLPQQMKRALKLGPLLLLRKCVRERLFRPFKLDPLPLCRQLAP